MLTQLLDQSRFRFRNDDGTETTATWKAVTGTNVSISAGEIFRLRLEIRETAGGTSTSGVHQLQYSRNGGAYTNITTSSSFIRAVNSPNVSNGQATSEQLAGPSAFITGAISTTGTVTLPSLTAQDTEVEFVLQMPKSSILNGDTIDFRITSMDSYSTTPRATAILEFAFSMAYSDAFQAPAQIYALTPTITFNPVSLGTPNLTEIHNFTALGVSAGTPTVGSPAITQEHNAIANTLDTGAVDLGIFTLTQEHALTATGIAAGSPTVGTPVFEEFSEIPLTANNLDTGAVSLGSPAVTQTHVIVANTLDTGAVTLGNGVFTLNYVFTANGVDTTAPTVGSPTVTQSHTFTANGVDTTAPTVGSPAVTQTHIIIANALDSSAPTVGSPVLAHIYNLDAVNVSASAPTVGSPLVTQSHTFVANTLDVGAVTLALPIMRFVAYIYPVSTESATGWVTHEEGTDLHTAISTPTTPDATYIRSPATPDNVIARLKLDMPTSFAYQPMRMRYRLARGGEGVSNVNVTIKIMQDTTLIKQAFHVVDHDNYIEFVDTLSNEEYSAITNFNNLYVEFVAGTGE